jgi:hypothetical protein
VDRRLVKSGAGLVFGHAGLLGGDNFGVCRWPQLQRCVAASGKCCKGVYSLWVLVDPMEQMSMGSSLQVILRQAAGEEQRPLVILGFLTGFGLSAVIGAAIYIYLTAG